MSTARLIGDAKQLVDSLLLLPQPAFRQFEKEEDIGPYSLGTYITLIFNFPLEECLWGSGKMISCRQQEPGDWESPKGTCPRVQWGVTGEKVAEVHGGGRKKQCILTGRVGNVQLGKKARVVSKEDKCLGQALISFRSLV